MRPNVLLPQRPHGSGVGSSAAAIAGGARFRNSNGSLRRVTNFQQTPFFFLIQNVDWAGVVRRAASHPKDLLVQDEVTGNTLCHEACKRDPPPNVVYALRSLIRVKNLQGATPVHLAASHRCSADALKVLLECGCSKQDDNVLVSAPSCSPTCDLSRMRRAPIHYACMSFRGLELDAFLVLLDATLKSGNIKRRCHGRIIDERDDPDISTLMLDENDTMLDDDDEDVDYVSFRRDVDELDEASFLLGDHDQDDISNFTGDKRDTAHEQIINVLTMKDATGQTPLALLFRRYRQRVRGVISKVDRLQRQYGAGSLRNNVRAPLASAMTVHGELGELWEKARRIISRLTQERLQRESLEPDVAAALSQHQQSSSFPLCLSLRIPEEGSVHAKAAKWATEQHRQVQQEPAAHDVLPVYFKALSASPAAAADSDNEENNNNSTAERDSPPASPVAANSPSCASFRIVHASVGLIGYGCPPEMIRLAVAIHPHQVTEMDEDGNLPLHIAARASSLLTTSSDEYNAAFSSNYSIQSLSSSAAALLDGADDRSVATAMSFFSSASIAQTANPFDKVIKILLQYFPEAARIPHGVTGNLPLVDAIHAGRRTWDDGIRTLLHAYPAALHDTKLLDAHLYPDILALVTSGTSEVPKSSSPSSTSTNNNTMTATASVPEGTPAAPTFQLDGVVPQGGAANANNNSTAIVANGVTHAATDHRKRQQQRRHDINSRTTLFELLRTKPEWLSPVGA